MSSSEAFLSLEAAATAGNIKIIDQSIRSGAGTAAWKQHSVTTSSQPTMSCFYMFIPMYRAIKTSQLHMIAYLPDLGFDFNNFSLSSIARSLLLAMIAIAKPTALVCWLFEPATNFTLITLLYSVLHFAAATLSLEVLREVSKSILLDDAPETGLTLQDMFKEGHFTKRSDQHYMPL